MSAKTPSQLNQDCKDFFQAVSLALQLHRSIAACLSEPVPLRRHKSSWPICYESAIALKLAALQKRSPFAVAAEIAAACAIEGWQIQTAPSGILCCQRSEPNIAADLQRLLSVPQSYTSPELDLERSPTDSFHVQYVHARCCMLLRSAEREGWFCRFDPPLALPWLTETNQLRLQQSIERQTIGLLLDAVDVIATGRTDRFWKQAIALSRQLDAFQAACRVWGEVQARDRSLAQARLGLTWAGQQLLQVLLKSLGLDAPTSL